MPQPFSHVPRQTPQSTTTAKTNRNGRFGPFAMVVAYLTLIGMLLAGCSNKPNVPFGTVTGKVTLNGEPLANAIVCFEPEQGRPSYGKTDDQGNYTLEYRGKKWGAIVGRHKVSITTESHVFDVEADTETITEERLPAKYNSESTLSVTVTAGKNVHNFDLTN